MSINLRQLQARIAALRVEAPDKPRSAAGEPWHVGFNDAIDEVLQLFQQLPAEWLAEPRGRLDAQLTGEAREAHDRRIISTAVLVGATTARRPRRRRSRP